MSNIFFVLLFIWCKMRSVHELTLNRPNCFWPSKCCLNLKLESDICREPSSKLCRFYFYLRSIAVRCSHKLCNCRMDTAANASCVNTIILVFYFSFSNVRRINCPPFDTVTISLIYHHSSHAINQESTRSSGARYPQFHPHLLNHTYNESHTKQLYINFLYNGYII